MHQHNQPSSTKYSRLGNAKAPLKFLTITTNPDIERRLAAYRRQVRSNAIRHAIRHGRRTANNLRYNQHQTDTPNASIEAENDAPLPHAQEPALSPRELTRPQTLWPNGTMTAVACSSAGELNLIACHFDRIRSHYSIFSSLLENPSRHGDLVAMILQSQVIYHATLYTAIMQQNKRSAAHHDLRSPLYHEGFVLRSVQDAIAHSSLPTDETIFATALLGISQLLFDNKCGSTHLEGVAQMIRLRGGIRYIKMPILFNLLEWLAGMYTSDVVDDAGHGHELPPHLYKQPRIPSSHGHEKALTPARELSFEFLAKRRILYEDLAQILAKLLCRDEAHTAVEALRNWNSPDSETTYEHVHQMDDAARLAGLLYHRVLSEGLRLDDQTNNLVHQLQHEILSLKNNRHIFGLLYYGCSNRLCLILWMLYCGGVFATGALRARYIQHIRSIYGQYGLSWSSTRAILMQFAFDDGACEGSMKRLWRQSFATRAIEVDAEQNASVSEGCGGWNAFILEHGGPAF